MKWIPILDNNNFSSIPPVVFDIPTLKTLSFANDPKAGAGIQTNAITRVSARIQQLTHLLLLNLRNNPVEDPPAEIIDRGAAAVQQYFAQLAIAGKDYLFEAKLLIVGEAGAGKTSLARKLVKPSYTLRDEDSTQGIEVSRWSFPIDADRLFRVNIWDFGGQEIYHATHQFFLTQRSLYVLVADARNEDTDFYYWLNITSLLSANSPIIVVINEKQERHRDISTATMRANFPNVVAVQRTNLATNRGLTEIRELIQATIRHLPHIGTGLPKNWVKVREALESDTRNHISLPEFLSICAQNGFIDNKDKLQLGGYLHDLGVCLHFQQDPILKNIVILKSKWGTDAVYKVLDNPEVAANQGAFSAADLKDIWGDLQYHDMEAELLQLMINLRLCYSLRDSNSYIAPQLLADRMPVYQWPSSDNVLLRYVYDFMPKGILTQLIVSMHEFIRHQRYVWKTGVIVDKGEASAEILEHYSKRELTVRIAGADRGGLRAIVMYELDRIHTTYNGLQYKTLVPCNCDVCVRSEESHFYSVEVLERFRSDKQLYIQCQRSYKMVEVGRILSDANIRQDLLMPGAQFVFHVPVKNIVVDPDGVVKGDITPVQIRSAWANGSFYLFAVLAVMAAVAAIVRLVPPYAVPAVISAAILIVPLVGALQLSHDRRLNNKNLIKLVRLVIQQLPLIRKKKGISERPELDS